MKAKESKQSKCYKHSKNSIHVVANELKEVKGLTHQIKLNKTTTIYFVQGEWFYLVNAFEFSFFSINVYFYLFFFLLFFSFLLFSNIWRCIINTKWIKTKQKQIQTTGRLIKCGHQSEWRSKLYMKYLMLKDDDNYNTSNDNHTLAFWATIYLSIHNN